MLIPETGSVCNFVFSASFATLNGIYTLTHTTQFETALADGVNFVEALYEPAGRTAADYDIEWTSYKKDTILRLVKPDDPETVIYVPSTLLAEVPDPMVIKAYDLYLAIDLGVFRDPDAIAWIVTQLDDTAASVTGTQDVTNVFRTKTVWMTQADYDALEADRKTRIAAIDLHSKTIEAMKKENQALKDRIAYYENAIIAAQTP